MLLFVAVSLGFGSIVGSVAVNMAVIPQGGVMLGNTVARSLLLHLKDGSSTVLSDRLVSLDEGSSAACDYETLRTQIGVWNVSFHVDIYAPLTVEFAATTDAVAVTVSKALLHEPVQAFVRLYVFNGSAVTATLDGETSPDGKVFFYTTIGEDEVGVIFAHSGASVGYAAFSSSAQVLQRGSLYVQDGELKGTGASDVYLFAFEDWWGPISLGAQVNVAGYSLPILFVYRLDGEFQYSPHPWVPGACGPYPADAAGAYVSDQLFSFRVETGAVLIMRLRVWGPGGQ
jgi:hypothetical protein